jgi:copper(I)-binding protein
MSATKQERKTTNVNQGESMNIKKTLVLFAAVLALGGLVAACGSDDSTSGGEKVSISDAWTRITTPTATTGAVYMKLESPDGDKLLKASVPTDVAAVTEIHETVTGDEAQGMNEGEGMDEMDGSMPSEMMGMRPIDGLDLPAGEEVPLEPGGYHIMLMELAESIKEGDTVPVTLTFEKAGEVEVEAEARES